MTLNPGLSLWLATLVWSLGGNPSGGAVRASSAGEVPGVAAAPLDRGGPPTRESIGAGSPAPAPAAGWAATAQGSIVAGAYAPKATANGFHVVNPRHALRGVLAGDGLTVRATEGGGSVRLGLTAWGREGSVRPVSPAQPAAGPCVSTGEVDAFGACLRRVQYDRPGLVEWWENRPEGLEQGFTLDLPPGGSGYLVFDLSVAGAEAVVRGGEASLVRPEGAPLRYHGLVAWDETGRRLPAWMEAAPGGLRLVVDDRAAVGAVTVDPLLTNPSWTADPAQAGAQFGFAVASAGDVNGDGYADVVIGAHAYDNGEADEGRAFVYLGSPTGLATTASWAAESDQAGASFGWSVASAGDVNGDGYGDVVIGARGYSNGESTEGRAYLYLGSATGLLATPSWTAESDQAAAFFGHSVASAGDVNGDGYDDVLVGAFYFDNNATNEGRASLFLGSASGLTPTPAWNAYGDQSQAQFGCSVSSAGDVNGDGFDDVIVGARGHTDGQFLEGRAYVFLGSATGPVATAAWTGEPDASGASFGASVSTAGDVDADGYDDVVIGAPGLTNGESGEGRTYVYLGSAAGLGSSASWTAEGNQLNANHGESVASAGDVNGDGYDDVIVGSRLYDNGEANEGRVFLYLGSATGLTPVALWTEESQQSQAEYATSVASAGDVNGDGYDDIVVGAPKFDAPGSNEGWAFLYLGACASVWYADTDGDGFGDPDDAVAACVGPADYVADATDCDDSDQQTFPGNAEACDGADNDCDGTPDDGLMFELYYPDLDDDGFGAGAATSTCDGPPDAMVADDTDCDDNDPAFNPGAVEADCTDPLDYNCDGAVGYADSDEDGYAACQDCDDADPDVNPDATELVGDAVDQDCDGVELCYVDADGDGYRDDLGATVASDDISCAGAGEATATAPTGDCDDADPAFRPDAVEDDCTDPADYDCDGAVAYADADEDGSAACEDCDDNDPDVNPQAVEIAGDDVDQDCDGADDVSEPTEPPEVEDDAACGGCAASPWSVGWLGPIASVLAFRRRRSAR